MSEPRNNALKTVKKKRPIVSVIGEVAADVVIVLFILFGALNLYLAIATKRNNAANLFGKQARLVLTGSMSPTIPTDSLVVVDTDGNHKDYEVGDILTFRYDLYGDLPTTHRVIKKETQDDGMVYYTLKGDNPAASGTQYVPYTDVIGKVTFHSLWMGKVVTFSKGVGGWICFVLVPCSLVIGYETIRIVKIVRSSKKEKEATDNTKEETDPNDKNQEIEALRKRVTELEEQKQAKKETQPETKK